MAKEVKIYKNKKVSVVNPDRTFIKIDGIDFKRPVAISASDLSKVLLSEIDEDMTRKNVSGVEFNGQDEDPTKEPEKISISDQINIAIDDSYLYIWVPSLKKWKRIMLGDWPEADLPPPAED
jgi:hypothetical protein